MIDFALCQHLYVKRQGRRISLALIFNSNNHIDCWGDYEDHKTTRTCRHGKYHTSDSKLSIIKPPNLGIYTDALPRNQTGLLGNEAAIIKMWTGLLGLAELDSGTSRFDDVL